MKRKANKIKVGDRVQFLFGTHNAVATVIEDRGPLGVGGRRIVVVAMQFNGEERIFEMPVADLTRVSARAKTHQK